MVVTNVVGEREIERWETVANKQRQIRIVRQEFVDFRVQGTRCLRRHMRGIQIDKSRIARARLEQQTLAARPARLHIDHRAHERLQLRIFEKGIGA